jgi:hypothetical protein
MASSPLSAPGSPRTASPLPTDDDTGRARSPSLVDAHTMAPQHEAGVVPKTSAPASLVSAPAASETAGRAPKGKEKAAKGPLRLLDLPVDILKEIIHQVRGYFFEKRMVAGWLLGGFGFSAG